MPAERLFPDRERRRRIWMIALPIMGGMMSQNILNLVDIGMVGRLGDMALAAAGIGSFTNYLAIAFLIGLSAGVQALSARRMGEDRHDETAVPLNGGIILAVLIGVPGCVLMLTAAPHIVAFLSDDPSVVAQGTPYLQARLVGMVAVGINFSFRGFWSAVHLTRFYLRSLLIMHSVNIFLNWVLIFGNLGAPALGVYGAGLATTIALYLGSGVYFVYAWRHARDRGFLHRLPSREILGAQFRLSLPSSLQQWFFSIGMVTLVWIVARIGTAEVAAMNVLMTLYLAAILPALSISLACTTLVGNALGRRDVDDAERWGWNTASMTAVYGLVLGALAVPLADPLLGVFIVNPDTRQLAFWPLILMAGMIGPDAAGMVLMNGLIGAGDTRRAMWISLLLQWVFFLPLAFLVGPVLGFGLLGVWAMNAVYRVTQVGVCVSFWRSRRWAGIEI